MIQYNDILRKVLEHGVDSVDRTGVGTIKCFGEQMRFNLADGYPAVTTKKLAFLSMKSELLWFIEGSHDERRLCEILHGTRDKSKRTIWTGNYENQGVSLGYTNGELGPIYGKQWREWDDTIVVSAMEHTKIPDYIKSGYKVLGELKHSGDIVLTRTIDQLALLIDGLKNDPYDRRHILTAWNVGELDKMALPPCHCLSQFFVNDNKLSCLLYQR